MQAVTCIETDCFPSSDELKIQISYFNKNHNYATNDSIKYISEAI
jgi:hypothetical protein